MSDGKDGDEMIPSFRLLKRAQKDRVVQTPPALRKALDGLLYPLLIGYRELLFGAHIAVIIVDRNKRTCYMPGIARHKIILIMGHRLLDGVFPTAHCLSSSLFRYILTKTLRPRLPSASQMASWALDLCAETLEDLQHPQL